MSVDCHTGTAAPTISKADLVQALLALLPADSVLFADEDMYPYECDGLSAYRQLPWVTVLPHTVAQVQAIMRLCYQHHLPVVARGAGTGLSGGALPRDSASRSDCAWSMASSTSSGAIRSRGSMT